MEESSSSSSSHHVRKSSRPGRGRGKSRGGGRGRGGNGGRSDTGRNSKGGRGHHRDASFHREDNPQLSDEDVMIAFMKYLREDQDPEAKDVLYRYGNETKVFIEKIRDFLKLKVANNNGNRSHEASGGNDSKPDLKIDDKVSNGDTKGPMNIVEEMQQRNESSSFEGPTSVLRSNQFSVITASSTHEEDGHHTSELEKMVANLIVEDNDDKDARSMVAPMVRTSLTPTMSPARPIDSIWRTDISPNQNMIAEGPNYDPPRTTSHLLPTGLTTINNKNTEPPEQPSSAETTTTAAPTKWQPKRLNTRLQDQPGKILANNVPATVNGKPYLILRPRQQLVATWQLPLSFLRERTLRKLQELKDAPKNGDDVAEALPSVENPTIRDALRSLTVGLFRRGCLENASSTSIIAKEVVPTDRNGKEEYTFEVNHQAGFVWGTVPFFTPRTPGNVMLRLYFEDEPIATLATSQCISVTVSHLDLEQTLRFILSNFKSKRNVTNFSSMHSLAAVLEQYVPSPESTNKPKFQNNHEQNMDGAGRAAWGGICESRKIFDAAREEYLQKKAKIDERMEELETSKKEDDVHLDDPVDQNSINFDDEDHPVDDEQKDLTEVDKKQALKDRASNERNWKEVQYAFASVLKSVVKNPSSKSLLKSDIIKKLELEYNLWCPLCERFAPNPFEVDHGDGSFSINYPYPINQKHFKACLESRAKMQQETLGFAVKTTPLSPASYQDENGNCALLTKSMVTFFNTEYGSSSTLTFRKKSFAKQQTQAAVMKCESFPKGTEVVVFGSSANGFGSPNSDLDMCLQLPKGMTITGEDGLKAMSTLAEKLEEAGMINVDTARLTARIPVIKFDCVFDLDGSKSTIECDISMQNPLACINTSLLYSYSLITPTVQIIAAVIKHWAKRRNINDPSHHTLSSYGYIIMLLHFLTTHRITEDGKLENIFKKCGPETPLLPNLQWIDQRWLQSPPGSPYLEWHNKPVTQYTTMKHPFEASYVVNTYFLHTTNEMVLTSLRQRIGCDTSKYPSVGFLLAAFFRYYAYQFDYKKYVVSLNATSRSGLVEREVKAEYDGWKLFGQALCVEDPFEEFYDVAHVLKFSSFQRIRREFALAYSKIVSASSESSGLLNAQSILDSICEQSNDEQETK